jgi:hypothetical protein
LNRIDHIVINTRDRTDQAVALFERMGFIVTPRGYHTLGSVNHTIVFQTDYLELLGYPPGKPPEKRPELVQHPAGLMATVLRADDADGVRAALLARGFAPRPASDFSRPVQLEDASIADASFRVTRLEPDAIPGSWFYYCQHLTPELVWQPRWQAHPNACVAMTALVVAVDDPPAAAAQYARAMDQATIDGTDPTRVSARLPGFEIILAAANGGAPGMRTLVLGSRSLAQTAAALTRGGVAYRQSGERLAADTWDMLGCALDFVPLAQSSL